MMTVGVVCLCVYVYVCVRLATARADDNVVGAVVVPGEDNGISKRALTTMCSFSVCDAIHKHKYVCFLLEMHRDALRVCEYKCSST